MQSNVGIRISTGNEHQELELCILI